jgi:hypothetical protein
VRRRLDRRSFLRRTGAAALPGLVAATAPGLLLPRPVRGQGDTSRPGLPLPREIRVGFPWKKLLILHAHLRVLAERRAEPPAAFAAAVAVYRRHRFLVPGRLIWFTMESYIANATDAASLRGQLQVFPLEFRSYDLAPTGKEIAEAIVQAEPAFDASVWPAVQGRYAAKIKPAVEEVFARRREKLLEFLFTSLNAGRLPLHQVDIHLLDQYVLTGHDTREINGRYFSVAESERFTPLGLVETVVMLLGRIIELEDQANAHGALFRLRERQESLHLPNPALFPRAVLYWTAGEAVRRVIDPEHEHVAEQLQIYQRALRSFVPGLKEFWNPYLDGKLALDEAIDGMVRRVGEA